MEHDKQLAFLQNMTHMALRHAATTPNVVTPKGGMTHEKMLSFVTAMAKHGLQHFDGGGTALSAPAPQSPAANVQTGGFNGAIGNFLGTNNKFQAAATPIQAGTNLGQLNNAYTQAQGGLGVAQNNAATLNTGLNQGAGVEGNLVDTYKSQIAGVGPNPAQDALNQNTGNNIAQAAAVAAGTRGAGANAGLIARNAAQQGAATQQQAVGQAATMQAQQQLAAETNLQNLAENQVAQGSAATQTFNNASQNEQNILQGANTSANNANVSQQENLNNVNAQISTANQKGAGNILSGVGDLLSNIPIIGGLFAEGGEVGSSYLPKRYAAGGITGMPTAGPQSYVGQWLNSSVSSQGPGSGPMANINTDIGNPFAKKGSSSSKKTEEEAPPAEQGIDITNSANDNPGGGWGVSDLSSPQAADFGQGNNITAPPFASGPTGSFGTAGIGPDLAKGGMLYKNGGKVNPKDSKEKAVVPGDSLSNDKVPAMLSQGEIVIPRHITMGPNAPARAAQFVAQQLAKRGKN